MVAPGAVPLAGWQQLLEDELRAHEGQPTRTLPYYAEVLPSYKQTTKTSPSHITFYEKTSDSRPPHQPSTKKEMFKAVMKGETSVYALVKQHRSEKSSSSDATSDASSASSSSKRSIWKHPILTGEHLPMYRLEESVDSSACRRQASAEYAAYRV
jgi:hypothetical protein